MSVANRTMSIPAVQALKPLAVGFEDAALMLGVSSRTIKRLDANNEFPHAFGGKNKGAGKGRRLIPVADLEAYMKRQARAS